jgi:hypothetical protein
MMKRLLRSRTGRLLLKSTVAVALVFGAATQLAAPAAAEDGGAWHHYPFAEHHRYWDHGRLYIHAGPGYCYGYPPGYDYSPPPPPAYYYGPPRPSFSLGLRYRFAEAERRGEQTVPLTAAVTTESISFVFEAAAGLSPLTPNPAAIALPRLASQRQRAPW